MLIAAISGWKGALLHDFQALPSFIKDDVIFFKVTIPIDIS